MEKLISLKPDAVVASALADKAVQNTIEQYGIKFYLLPSDKLSDYPEALGKLGQILKCESTAAEKIEDFNKRIKQFREENKTLKRHPRVYLEVWNNPYMTVGRQSFINEMILSAGGENIAAEIDKGYFNFSLEWLLKSDPEIIICPAMSKEAVKNIEKREGWQKISAVRNHKIYTGIDNDILYRLGPRMIDGIALLKKIIRGKADNKLQARQSNEK
jgi:iron complex transport system substrate-binding protein